jgi:EAL domain-containing protein (putative c-di-GMP-specific phosphodiesterase class I)
LQVWSWLHDVKYRERGAWRRSAQRHGFEDVMVETTWRDGSFGPERLSGQGGTGVPALVPVPAHAVGAADLGDPVRHVLALAREELAVEVTILPTAVAVADEQGTGIDVPLVRADGTVRGALRVTTGAGADGDMTPDHPTLRLLARLVAEQLDAQEAQKSTFALQTERIAAVLRARTLELAYQPIVNLRTGDVEGMEALARFPGPPELTPDRWFRDAASVGLGDKLELLAVSQALVALDRLPEEVYLSVNVSPEVVVARAFAPMLAEVPLHRLVIELTEHAAVADYSTINAALGPLRDRGLRVAVDDAGAGFASLRHILEMSPDIIKLDISLTHHIDQSSVLRALSYSLAAFASAIDASVVAEGIENERELQALRFLGVGCGQGFFLQAPGPLPARGRAPLTVLSQTMPA